MPTEPRPAGRRSVTRLLPPLLWMGLIALGSSSVLSGDRTGLWMAALAEHLAPWASPGLVDGVHFAVRKLGHLIEFGILSVLWHRALVPSSRAVTAAFTLAAAYGGLDELRQGLDPSRVPAWSDVAVDAVGAWLGLAAWVESTRLGPATLRGAAVGAGLLAGLAVLGVALDAMLGRPVIDVGLAALGLGLVAAGLARLARGAARRVSTGLRAPRSP